MTIDALGGWVRTAAATWLLVVGCLAAWSFAPMALGWRPVVVVTGSMEPHVHPGDVVLVDTGARTPGLGQVALLRDPEMPTGSKLHRVVRVADDGTMTTRGDANQSDDTRVALPSDVEGVARLLVPNAGRFLMPRRSPTRADLLWAAATVLSGFALAVVPTAPGPEPRPSGRRAARLRERAHAR